MTTLDIVQYVLIALVVVIGLVGFIVAIRKEDDR